MWYYICFGSLYNVVMKVCTRCHQEFESEQFKWCDDCRAKQRERSHKHYNKHRTELLIKQRGWRKENREKENERHRIYREDNKEKELERHRKYREDNPEKIREKNRKYNIECRDIKREGLRKWRKKNPEKVLEWDRNYRKKNPERERARHRRWYANNLDKERERRRQRYLLHREKLCNDAREYRKAHPEVVRSAYTKYHKEHKEHYAELKRKWHQKHPYKYGIYRHNRRARIKSNGGSYTEKEINDLYLWQQGHCHYCNDWLYKSEAQTYLGSLIHGKESYHIEHKTPIIRGGSNYISNIALSCPDCNGEKNDKTEEEYFDFLAKKDGQT